ncbi:MAG: rhodanese-like domain-containing protein, partial [Steroidobacteraceae bacterium]|nr:rhodanese-like domain-containing protein [Steroidobacteraceae bacterium]
MQTRTSRFALMAALAVGAAAYADGGPAPITPDAFLALPKSGADAPFVLDVRTPGEYVAGHVPGAVNIPHDQLATRLAEVPKDKDVVLYCRSGKRAAMAGDVLADSGYTRLQHLEGDILAWQAQQRPVEVPRDAAACAAALSNGESQAA